MYNWEIITDREICKGVEIMYIFLSVCSLLVPLSMILLGYKWKENPPKDRQGISGYRTTMSRLNDDTWKCAHQY